MSDFIMRYAIALAAVGTLTMALLEAYKSVFKTRDKYHMRVLRDWIMKTPMPEVPIEGLEPSRPQRHPFREEVYRQLILLTTGQRGVAGEMTMTADRVPWRISHEEALFSLELEKMMGQIQDAADIALSNPGTYPELYLFLTIGADAADVLNWYRWAIEPPTSTSEDRALAKKQADTYARLRQLIRRRLDALQLTATYRWRTLNQFYAVAVGAVILFLSQVYLGIDMTKAGNWIKVLLVSLSGGMLAPVAKDLVVALKRVRGG
jgi:hypothetical protein